MLQQIVHIVDPAGAGVFNRHDGVIGLTGFDLLKDIGEFRAAAFDKLLKMTRGVLARGKM